MIQTEIINQYEIKLHEQILKVFHASGMRLHKSVVKPNVYKRIMINKLNLIIIEVH